MIYNLLSQEPGTRTAITFLTEPMILVATIILVIGIVITLLAKVLTLRADKSVNALTYKESKTYKIILLIGCIAIFVGLLLTIIGTSIIVCQF